MLRGFRPCSDLEDFLLSIVQIVVSKNASFSHFQTRFKRFDTLLNAL